MKKRINNCSMLVVCMMLTSLFFACIVPPRDNANDPFSDNASEDKLITAYSILGVEGEINDEEKTISVLVPHATALTALVATFTTSGILVEVNGVEQVSGLTENDFTSPVRYTVTAYDLSTVLYTVTVMCNLPNDFQAVAADKEWLEITYSSGDNSSSVTGNVILPSAGPCGTNISWASNGSSIVSTAGAVTRPSFSSGDALVTLTATISKGSESDTKDFILTIIKAPQTDAEAVAADKAVLDIIYASGDSALSVTGNLTLVATGPCETTITWSSDDTDVIADNGTVTRPAYSSEDAPVIMTATISKGIESDTKDFDLTVIKAPQTDAEAVAADKAVLAITYAPGDSASHVTQNLTLLSTGPCGTTNTWESGNTDVIANDGTVTRPENGSGDAEVTMTATISKNAANDTKDFVLTVKEMELIGTVPRDGLVGEWLFSDAGVATTGDTSGNNNTGTVNGATAAADRFGNAGKAYSFDGNDDSIDAGNNDSIKIDTNDFTLSIWINTTKHSSTSSDHKSSGSLIYKGAYASNLGYWLYIRGDEYGSIGGKASVEIDSGECCGTNLEIDDSGIVTINNGEWHHIIFVADRDGTGSLYIDGNYFYSEAISDENDSLNNNINLIFGMTPYGLGFNGFLDDIRIYNRALSADEISALYHEGGWDMTDSASVAADKTALEITYTPPDSASSVTQNLTLATEGQFGTTISWVSGNTDVIANDGTVTRPDNGSGDTEVTLTATISKGSENDTKEFAVTVKENTLYDFTVCSSGCDFTTIQSAIDAATGGDTIGVSAGTYSENITVNKTLTIIGAGMETTIIQASNANAHACTISANDVTISGFTINGATGTNYAAIYLSSVTGAVLNNLIISNNYRGVYFYSSSSNQILNSILTQNYEFAINMYQSSTNNTISGNTVSYVTTGHGIGTGDQSNSGTIIENNIVYSTNGSGIIGYAGSNNMQIRGNTVYDCGGSGICIGWSSGCLVENNSLYNNSAGFTFDTASSNIVRNNKIYSNSEIGVEISGLGSTNNQIYNNTIAYNNRGINFGTAASGNIIRNNLIERNTIGVNIAPNTSYTNTNNKVYSNNIISNTTQTSDTSNIVYYFDNGSTDGGNYWSNWTTPDADSNGFVDNPYIVQSGYSQDNYPYTSILNITTPNAITTSYVFSYGWGGFSWLHGIGIDKTDNIYVADQGNNIVKKYLPDGTFVTSFGSGYLVKPMDIKIGSDGDMYIAEYENHRMVKYDSSGQLITTWSVSYPFRLALDSSDNVYVASRNTDKRINKYDSNGSFITSFANFNNIHTVAVDQVHNFVYVTEADNNTISKYNLDGSFIKSWGETGSGDGQMARCEGMTVDKYGCIYVTEAENNRIQKFTSDGKFITKWGTSGSDYGQFLWPNCLVIDSLERIFVESMDKVHVWLPQN